MKTSTSALALLALLGAAPALAQQTTTPAETTPAETTPMETPAATQPGTMAPAAETEADVTIVPAGEPEVIIVDETAETTPAETTPVVETEAVDVDVDVVGEPEVAEGTPVEGQMFDQSPDTFLASTLMDADVQSSTGEDIGEVNDMVISADGTLTGVVIGVGGFLGIGEKDVAIAFDRIEILQEAEGDDLTFVLNATEDELDAAPAFRTRDDIRAEESLDTLGAPMTTDGVVTDGVTTDGVVTDGMATDGVIADPMDSTGAVVDPSAPAGAEVEPRD